MGTYSPKEYWDYVKREEEISVLKKKSRDFKKRRKGKEVEEGEIEDERSRRKFIARLEGKMVGKYEGDPEWDDVVPVAQDEGEGALAAIAYTDEYAEGISPPSFSPNIPYPHPIQETILTITKQYPTSEQ